VLCIAQAMLGDGAHALSPSWLPGASPTSGPAAGDTADTGR
jgi:hypothetical protein